MTQQKKGRRKWLWLVVGVVVLVVVMGWLRGRTAVNQAAQAQVGDVVVAFIGDLAASATANGRVVAQAEAALSLTTSGTVAEVAVAVGDKVEAGDLLVRLETAELERAVVSAEQSLIIQQANLESLLAPATLADIAAAEAALASAEASLADLLTGPSADELAAAEADVRVAEADVVAAQANLNSAATAGSAEAVRAAEIQLQLAQQTATTAAEQHSTVLVTDNEFISDEQLAQMELAARANAMQANANLATAQEAYNKLIRGDANTIAASQAGVAAAVANRDAALAQLALQQQGAAAVDVAAAESQVAQAAASLAQLVRGPSALQVTQAEVAVAQAQIAWQRAELNLAQGVLVAPFAGTVTAVHVGVGELASGVLVEMVAADGLEVVLDVDEVDVGAIGVGQTAVLTLEAWPNDEISGAVRAIAPKGTTSSGGLVTYAVYLSLAETDLPLLVGMTANASLVTANREAVLLVPNSAIEVDRATGTYRVNRVERDAAGAVTTVTVPVTIGLRDNLFTQVVSGLDVGDEVMIGRIVPVQQSGGMFGGN